MSMTPSRSESDFAYNSSGPLLVSDASPALSAQAFSPVTKIAEGEPHDEALPKLLGESDVSTASPSTVSSDKDFSFLLDVAIYHPLGQIDIPAPFRQPFPPPPTTTTSLNRILADIEILLSNCNFIGAAHLSGLALTSGLVPSTDAMSIFHLLAIRYSSLELSGNVLLAAQEAKALEDLSSTFYYPDKTHPDTTSDRTEDQEPLPKHVVPFHLRLQALRLQSIGFSDPRRGISALYDLGLECRQQIASPLTAQHEVKIWEQRLAEVGIRVVNALIEQGDLDCAYRSLQSMSQNGAPEWTARMVLLCIKMGMIERAERFLQSSQILNIDRMLLSSLLLVARGEYQEAAELLSSKLDVDGSDGLRSIAEQNLACAYLYAGQSSKCRKVLEGLVVNHHSFQTLTINLATMYELSSDKAGDLKMTMANKVAEEAKTNGRTRAYLNADFKL